MPKAAPPRRATARARLLEEEYNGIEYGGLPVDRRIHDQGVPQSVSRIVSCSRPWRLTTSLTTCRPRLSFSAAPMNSTDASVQGAAEVLTRHPNTVRHRLHRIEKRTGRSLSRPRDVAELCLAFEVHRRLM